MQFLKGQSDIIAVVLIVLIAIGLLAVAYTFGVPLITKNQDQSVAERVDAMFNPSNSNSLPAKLENVANSGGKDSLVIDVTGITRLYPGCTALTPCGFARVENNSLEFSFQGTVSKYATGDKFIPLNPGSCDPTPISGIIGQDSPVVVCVNGASVSAGKYNVTYRMYLRELDDVEQKNGFAINLEQDPAGSLLFGGSKVEVQLSFDKRRQVVQGAKNLIITDVKVLLI